MSANDIYSILKHHPELRTLSLSDLATYVELVQILKPQITCGLTDEEARRPPERLLLHCHEFLYDWLKSRTPLLEEDSAKVLWRELSPLAWEDRGEDDVLPLHNVKNVSIFLEFGYKHQICKCRPVVGVL